MLLHGWGAHHCYLAGEFKRWDTRRAVREGAEGGEKTVQAQSYGPPSLPYTHNGWQGMVRKVGEIPSERHVPGTERAGSFT